MRFANWLQLLALWPGSLAVVAAVSATAVAAPSPAQPGAKPEPVLTALLPTGNATSTKARRAWEHERERLRREWLKVLGEFPHPKPPLKTEVLATEELPEFTRQHIRYQVEAGIYTDGYLLTPRDSRAGTGIGSKHKTKRRALVVFHATTEFGARGPAGLEPAYPTEKWHGVQFAQRGWIVWCPRNYINTPGTNYAGNATALLAQHPGWTGMTRMTWDAIRAMDFLASWPGVDRKCIACFGHSLGAKEVLYSMAFDKRYCAGVFSEGGIGLEFSNWDAPWYLGKRIRQPGFGREHHELLALAAPRPFLLIAGDSADDSRSELFVNAVKPVYQLWDVADRVRFFNHHQGHVYGPEARRTAEEFLDRN